MARVWHRQVAYRGALSRQAMQKMEGSGTQDRHDPSEAVRAEFCWQKGGWVEEASGVRKTC